MQRAKVIYILDVRKSWEASRMVRKPCLGMVEMQPAETKLSIRVDEQAVKNSSITTSTVNMSNF